MRTCVHLATAVAAALTLVAGCRPNAAPTDDGRVRVAVTIAPHAYFVQRIGGQRVSVQVLVPPGQDPHTYDVTPQALRELSRTRLYFTAGLEIEKTLAPRIERVAGIRIVDTLAGLDLAPGDHGSVDPHVWLSPRLAAAQAATIRDALTAADPAGREAYHLGYRALAADLEAAGRRVAQILAPHRGRRFYIFHPAWGYFAREAGLEQVAVEVDGKEPTARRLAALVEGARSEGARAVFAQPHVSTAAARSLAREIGAEVVVIDELAADYLDNLVRAAAAIAAALR